MISSRDNPKLKLVRKLAARRQRDKLGLFACEGEDLVEAALAGGWELELALVDAARPPGTRLPRAEQVASNLLAEVSTLGHAPRVIGVFRAGRPERELPPLGLGLWRVGDPGNVGTLARACDAFGAYLALSTGCADPFGPKALRASAGSVFRVPLAEFSPEGAVALVAHDAPPLAELDPSLSRFVLGSEREGLPEEVVAVCAATATIPLVGGAESLNVAMAGTIALYDWRRSHG
ncbi:MAG: methyltransferase, TrmH family [Gaiellaceae bacterium]|jgi:TrmH family RNA methyltransferase|nr:methyltransferase, TrmH family [Gaiellaceae bacterium]